MSFIKRNMPVLVIGLVTIVVFVLIIVLGQKNPPTAPVLKQVDEKELVVAHAYTLGPANAPVTLTEFSDFECPACAAFEPIVKDMISKYPNTLKLVYRYFPLPQHPNSELASQAAALAGEQGKFWEYGALLFQNQPNATKDDLIKYAQSLNLDMEKFSAGLNSGSTAQAIKDDVKEGLSLGIESTPTFFLNGRLMIYASFQDFQDQIASETGKYEEQAKTPPNSDLIPLQTTQTTMSQTEIDKAYGVLPIAFTDNGFVPRNTNAKLGQLVRWTNTTQKEVLLEQLVDVFSEFKNPVAVKAGGTYELRLYIPGYWRYRERNSLKGASIQITDPNKTGASQ